MDIRIKLADKILHKLISSGVAEDVASYVFDRMVDGMLSDRDNQVEEIYNSLLEGEEYGNK